MQELSFEDYKNKPRETERFYKKPEERDEMPFIGKLGMGVAATLGALAVGHRTGAFRKISQFLNTEGKAVYRAAKETLDNQGRLVVGEDKLTVDRMKVLKSNFIKRRKEILSEQKKKQADVINSREMDIERYLRHKDNLIGRIDGPGKYKGEVPFHIQEGFRFAAVMDDMRKHPSFKGNNSLMDELDKALSKGKLGVLDFGSDEQLKLLLKNHGKGVDHSEVWSVLKQTRERYQRHDFIQTNTDAKRLVEGMQQKLREFTAQQMQGITKKDNILKRAVIGHKQATVGDVLGLHDAGKIKMNAGLKAQIDDVLQYNKSFKETVFDENLYLVTKNGEVESLMDYKVFSNMKRNQAEWWANTLPGGLAHLRDIMNIKTAKEQASFKIFQRGSIQSSLNGHRGIESTEALNQEVVYVNGKFVSLYDYDAINNNTALNILNPKRDMYLTSSQFGTLGKMQRHISGIMTDNETPRNPIASFFDVGRQDTDSFYNQGFSVFTKFLNKDWDRNRIKNLFTDGFEDASSLYQMNKYFKLNTKGFNPRVLNQLKDDLPSDIRDFIKDKNINFSEEDDIVKLFRHIGEKEVNSSTTAHTEFVNLYKQFERNPDKVLNKKTPIGESNPILGHHTQLQTGYDVIHQQTSMYLMRERLMRRPEMKPYTNLAEDFRGELKGLYDNGKILKDDLQNAEFLLNYSIFRSQMFDVQKNTNAVLNRTSRLFQENKDFQDSMREMYRKTNPVWERYSETRPINQVEDEHVAINKSGMANHLSTIFGLNSSIKERAQSVGDIWSQISPFTGRNNMEDVTTFGLFGTYYPMFRLQDSLGNAGLGFSDKSMGSAFQIFNNLMWKRIFPIYAGVEAVKYADWKTDQWTGEGLDERWENYKANDRLDRAAARTPEDIYNIKRERMLKPGIDHWAAMPSMHLPGVGPIGLGDVVNNIFAPFLGKASIREEDTMDYDETLDDIYNGVEEVRKSRWWFMGSKSAYRGDRIMEFAPNSFRKAHSDYEWTNTNATGEEYWSNSLLPTLENPLGGLSFLLGNRDPYWWEKKHYYDRPYMLTGQLFNPNTMVLGDIGNATIGKLVKPTQEMHPEYWGNPTLIYDNETSKLGSRPESPIRTVVSPAGRVKNDVLATTEQYGGSSLQTTSADINNEALLNIEQEKQMYNTTGESYPARYFVSDELDEKGSPTGAYVAQDTDTGQAMYVPANIAKENIPISKMFEIASTDAPQGSEMKGTVLSSENPSYNVQVSTKPRAMMDEEYAYKQDIMYRKMQNIEDPRSASWLTQEAIENWSEPLGVYKWLANDEMLGRDPYGGKTVIQMADTAYNASNRFWESELGSLGGSLSEIGRRFIRRDSGQLDTYNPIRNTMPDWMPGSDYFINFQVGDPYSKLPNGEYRLPGEAYESLNELHSDETGRYGAFDKFKILSDAAPWSDEYKFWSQYLMDNLEDEDLRKEATQIRKQVSKRKKKFEFTPYRFKGNDIVTDEVTVTKFLDDYTFLTKEYGDQPIRMAGMEYRKKATGVLQQYFSVGDKVEIGISEDPTQRISKDTYGTMRAVVFNEIGNINMDIIRRGEMVENQNDFSATGVHARFTPQEIKRGERWENIAHASTPLNTKFLQVRTAVEEYERDQIYGKDWATWDNFMLNDYIVPTLQGIGRFDSPLWSMAAGATTGLALGRLFLKGGRPTKLMSIAGGLFGLGSNVFYKNYEKEHGEKWIPERRRIENDINEYFDILKYLKYEGLYQNAREEIAHQTGYDVEDIVQVINEQKDLTKQKRKELEEEKKQLYLEQPKGWEDRRKEINAELETISENKNEMYLPDAFLQALQYKEERDTTLYGIDPLGDRMQVMKAFPYKDKWFFTDFAEASLKEQEEILKLIPENQKRIYKAIWGYGVEEQKPLEYYMQKYDIPDWTWEGWRPEYDLNDIKVKTVEEAGIDKSDFNFWDDNVEASRYVPDLHEDGSNTISGEGATSNFQGFNILKQNLVNILQGSGLRNVQVNVSPSNGSETYVDFSYNEDRRDEIENHLKKYTNRYV